ncbi:MAG: carbamoyltransferase [Deltaproteobacteria bacterium]|nr:carbamoyltransferase [Deltaproteobacteria bacterium]
MNVLGLSFMYHDSAACLLKDGIVVAAAAEERFSRKKHSLDFPTGAIRSCLSLGDVPVDALDAVVFYEKPLLKFERIVTMNSGAFPRGFALFADAMPLWLKYKLFIREMIRTNLGYGGDVFFADHHYAHASSAFFPSGFDEAAVLTMDGVGEWATMTRGRGEGNRIHLTHELRYPHSLGLLYSTVTAFLGFRVNSGEGKVMGLSSYGNPTFRDRLLDRVIDLRDDGSFRLNLDYFSFHRDLVMYSPRFVDEFGEPRKPESDITARDEDLACSLQDVVNTACLNAAAHVGRETGSRRLCIAGGVGLNSVANGRILEEGDFDEVFIQPASGDDGGAIGSALFYYHQVLGNPRRWHMEHAFLGSADDPDEVQRFLDARGMPYRRFERTEDLVERAASDLARGRIVGWCRGRMEYGPRALGNRSILASPTIDGMQDVMNERVKHRESFRPFAPAVLLERVGEFFDPPFGSPFMLLVARTRPDKKDVLGAVTHVDGTARLQTVDKTHNPRFHDLIARFGETTGVPVLLNTSFNIRGEPIVRDCGDALTCFLNTGIDCLALEDCYLVKEEDPGDGKTRRLLPPLEWE